MQVGGLNVLCDAVSHDIIYSHGKTKGQNNCETEMIIKLLYYATNHFSIIRDVLFEHQNEINWCFCCVFDGISDISCTQNVYSKCCVFGTCVYSN